MILSFVFLVLVWFLPIKGKMVCEQREQSQLLKFVASLIVVVGHEACFYGLHNETFMRETALGAFCVSFFLFMSGYGLLYSFVKKQQRLSWRWFWARIVKLIVPALTAMALYVIAEIIVGRDVDWSNLLTYGFVSDANLRYGWYVSEIIVLYIAFFVFYRYLSVKCSTILLCLAIGVTAVVMVAVKCAIWYVLGLPCFVLGLLLAKCDVDGTSMLTVHLSSLQIRLLFCVAVVLFFLSKDFFLVQEIVPVLDKWRYALAAKFVSNIVFVVIVTYILKRLPVCKVMVNRGGDFYEVYLVQGATLLVCREWIINDWLFVILGLMCTIFVAKGMSMVNNWIVKRICFYEKK